MRGWERVTQTDLTRLAAKKRPAEALKQRHKFFAEPCIVTADLTLFTKTDIEAVELSKQFPPIGPLLERAARCGINGRWFASKKEGLRYIQLRTFERAGLITNLECQVEYTLTVVSLVDGTVHKVGKFTLDFVYHRDGTLVHEDTKGGDRRKGPRTEAYQLRKRIFEAQYGWRVLET